MRDRLHGVLADVVVESVSLDGFYNSEEVMARVQQVGGDDVIAHGSDHGDSGHSPVPRSAAGRSPGRFRSSAFGPRNGPRTGDFAEFLFDEKGQKIPPSFEVPERAQGAYSPAGELV